MWRPCWKPRRACCACCRSCRPGATGRGTDGGYRLGAGTATRSHDGTSTPRAVEPCRIVSWGRRWYLVAWDVDRDDWRTFRADRITPRTPTGPRFPPRDPPEGGAAAYVARGVSAAAWRHRARVVVHAPADVVTERINPAVGVVEAIDEHTCVLDTGADTIHTLAVHLGLLDVDFEGDVSGAQRSQTMPSLSRSWYHAYSGSVPL